MTMHLREKNVYLLHLDTPRILIISSVIIGLIIVSFMIGINFNKKNKDSNDMLTQKDPFIDAPVLENGRDDIPLNKMNQQPADNKLSLNSPENENMPLNDEKSILQYNSENANQNKDLKENNNNSKSNDAVVSDNSKDTIQPVKEASNTNDSKNTEKSSKSKLTGKKSKEKRKN